MGRLQGRLNHVAYHRRIDGLRRQGKIFLVVGDRDILRPPFAATARPAGTAAQAPWGLEVFGALAPKPYRLAKPPPCGMPPAAMLKHFAAPPPPWLPSPRRARAYEMPLGTRPRRTLSMPSHTAAPMHGHAKSSCERYRYDDEVSCASCTIDQSSMAPTCRAATSYRGSLGVHRNPNP
jgi:hypothetical protein